MSFVIDASVTASWCFEDEHAPVADAAMDKLLDGGAIVPALWRLEVRNIMLINERRGRIEPADADSFLAELERLPISVLEDPSDVDLMDSARKHRLTAYDASYLALAIQQDAPLATLDRALHRAGQAEGVTMVAQSPVNGAPDAAEPIDDGH